MLNCFYLVGGHFFIPMAIYISMANECHCILNTNSCEVHFNKLGLIQCARYYATIWSYKVFDLKVCKIYMELITVIRNYCVPDPVLRDLYLFMYTVLNSPIIVPISQTRTLRQE